MIILGSFHNNSYKKNTSIVPSFVLTSPIPYIVIDILTTIYLSVGNYLVG